MTSKNHLVIVTFAILYLTNFARCSEQNCDNDSCKEASKKRPSRDIDVTELLEDLKISVKSVKESCGEVCETRAEHERVKKEFGVWSKELEKNVDCHALFSNPEIDAYTKFVKPIRKIPKFLLDDFSYQGRIEVEKDYFDDSDNDGRDGSKQSTAWSAAEIDELTAHFNASDEPVKWYTENDVKNIKRNLRELKGEDRVQGKHVLVIGTKMPWLESILLSFGASHITTLEYDEIKSEHPKVTAITPWKMSEMYLKGILPEFDMMVTFSSVEHSGLGRYGDQLNPFGDLITMARAWCVLKPSGLAVVGVPVHGRERVVFNANRVYGADVTLPHLFANFEQVSTDMDQMDMWEQCHWCYQPIFVARKPK